MSVERIRYATAESGGGLNIATIPLGNGDWEILTASIQLGAFEYASIRVLFENRMGDGTAVDNYIMSGFTRRAYPLIMQGPKIVRGPGTINTIGVHTGTFNHHIVVSYRRITL